MESRRVDAGLLGRYYSARHAYGHYRSCAVTGRYVFSKPLQVYALLKFALSQTIERHPSLCYGITEKSEDSDTHFILLSSIQWDDVVEIHTSSEIDMDNALAGRLGVGHGHLFVDHHKPAWKLVILEHHIRSLEQGLIIDLVFINHHAVCDGLSGSVFHKTLLKALYEGSDHPHLHAEWPFVVPAGSTLPLSLEKALNFHVPPNALPTSSMAKAMINNWTAEPPSLPSIDSFTSRVSFITITSSQVHTILKTCRRLQITLTALLHGLMTLYLSRFIPDTQGFRASTAVSMRRFTALSMEEIANHISAVAFDLDSSIVETARLAEEGSEEEGKLIENVAAEYTFSINAELERIPSEGPEILKAVSRINDLDQWCQEAMKKKRDETWEVSNLGVVKMPEEPEGTKVVSFEKMVFTQCGMVAGAAIGCSVVSVYGGPLVVSLHWQEGIVEERIMKRLRDYLERRLSKLGDEESI